MGRENESADELAECDTFLAEGVRGENISENQKTGILFHKSKLGLHVDPGRRERHKEKEEQNGGKRKSQKE